MNPSELRDVIARRLTEASAIGGIIYPNSTLVDAILDAVIASLPEELDTDGSFGKWVNGYNDGVDEVRKLLTQAKKTQEKAE